MNKKTICNQRHNGQNRNHHHRKKRGPSSFDMHDSEHVFKRLSIKEGDTFLDLGCGAGDYSLYAAKLVGESGTVYALDLWDEMLEGLRQEALKSDLHNMNTMVSDICRQIPVKDRTIDICMLATVLHIESIIEQADTLFSEIKRVLKPGGILAVIECKKEKMFFGPPVELRIAPEKLEKILSDYGFKKMDYVDLGFNYMITFEVLKEK